MNALLAGDSWPMRLAGSGRKRWVITSILAISGGSAAKTCRRPGFDTWVEKIPEKGKSPHFGLRILPQELDAAFRL